jgi:copper(I)-binding protein
MTAIRSLSLFSLFATCLLSISACNQDGPAPPGEIRAGALHITGTASRETPIPGAVAVGYLRVQNTGSSDDVLLGASAAIATGVELHEMKTVDGLMQMRALSEGLAIPAGKTVELKSGGAHLMLLGIARPLVVGEKIPVTLRFKEAGSVDIELKVGPLVPAGEDSTH